MSKDLAVSLRGITNRFGKSVIHQDLDLDILRGEILALIGGSGSGKSVLLRTIIGLQKPASGSIKIMGSEISGGGKALEEARRNWGVLFQDGALFSSLTVEENVCVPLRQYTRLSARSMREIAALKIAMAGLPPEAGAKYPSELSGGMRKRAGLARALAMEPELLFLDEPTAGLDPISAAAFDELVHVLSKSMNLTVCLVTHDIDTLYAVCDRVAVLAEKRIYAVDTIDKLSRLEQPWIKEYFNGPRGRAALETSSRGSKAAKDRQAADQDKTRLNEV